LDRWVPLVCILAPFVSYVLSANSKAWFNGYVFSYEILLVNALITMSGLWMISKKPEAQIQPA